jgi:hypothetical protein
MDKSQFDDEMLDLLAYMLTSARGLPDEPAMYGPFRLIEGASRLCGILANAEHGKTRELRMLQEKIDEKKYSLMTDENEFIELMDEAVLAITHILMEENNT